MRRLTVAVWQRRVDPSHGGTALNPHLIYRSCSVGIHLHNSVNTRDHSHWKLTNSAYLPADDRTQMVTKVSRLRTYRPRGYIFRAGGIRRALVLKREKLSRP